jgi:hypothetical protein
MYYFDLKKMKKLLSRIDELKKIPGDEERMSIINYEQKGEIIKEVSTDYNFLWQTNKGDKNVKIIHFTPLMYQNTQTNFVYNTYICAKYLLYKILNKNISPIFENTFNRCRNLKYLRAYKKYQKEALAIMEVF